MKINEIIDLGNVAGVVDAMRNAGQNSPGGNRGGQGMAPGSNDGGGGGGASKGQNNAGKFGEFVPIPTNINSGLRYLSPNTAQMTLGAPSSSTQTSLNIDQFKITCHKLAVQSLQRIFSEIKATQPELYPFLGDAGCFCIRNIRGGNQFSSHAWGTAIDITIGNVLTPLGSTTCQMGLTLIVPIFNKHQWFWGGGYNSRKDCMHFEVSEQLMNYWKTAPKSV